MNTTRPLDGNEEDIRAIATPIFQNILAAHDTGDYSLLEPLLSDALKSALDAETFAELIDDHFAGVGASAGSTWLGSLRKEDATQVLWKVSYGDDHPEVLWQVFLTPGGDALEVAGLLFS